MPAKIIASIEIFRPHNMLAAMLCILSGYYIAGGTDFSLVFYPVAFTGLVAGCGNLINDYFDVEIDRINKPRRPIPSGRLSAGFVLRLYLIGSLIVTALMILSLPVDILIFILSWEVLLFLYGFKVKRLPVLGNILVASIAASAFFAGALVAGAVHLAVFPFLFAFLFVMGRELVKGAEDLEGDISSGAMTLAAKLGVEKTMFLASFFLFLCIVIAPLPAIAGDYGRIYFFVMELTVVPGLLVTSFLVLNHPNRIILNRVSWILKGEMFCGIVGMGLAQVRF